MFPEHPRDAISVDRAADGGSNDAVGPTPVETATALRDAVGPGAPSARPKRRKIPLVRLRARPRTIRDTPEEQEERKSLLESRLVGWTGSVVFHALVIGLLLLIALVLPKSKPRASFDTEIGTPLGSEDGFDRLGGFDDDLLAALDLDPTALSPDSLLSPSDPNVALDANQILSDAVRPEIGSSSGIGGGAFGIARFGEGLETIQGVEVKVGDPQFTLVWDTPSDIDLHVIEPGGAHIYWAERQGKRNGELDVDDTDGFGPENIYWLDTDASDDQKVKGQGPSGVYHWYVRYYGAPGGFDARNAPPTRWKVRVKHAGQIKVYEGLLRRVDERSDVRSLRIGPEAADAF